MKKNRLLLIALLLVWLAPSFAARVDTLLVKSPSMNKEIKVVVVTPDAALGKKAVSCPAVYLLHGFGGHAKTWIEIKPNLPQIADEKGIIFVCPDGSTSWYWDSPKDPSFRYETFVSSELVKYIDGHYKTIADRKGRAITGLSMGGHGGLWTASVIKILLALVEAQVAVWIFARSRRTGIWQNAWETMNLTRKYGIHILLSTRLIKYRMEIWRLSLIVAKQTFSFR